MLCNTCEYFDRSGERGFGFCAYVEMDDPDYPHNNQELVGIDTVCADDTNLQVRLRVSPSFGCVNHRT